VTSSRFGEVNEQAQRELAGRLAGVSDVLDFEAALEIVQFDPAKAEELILMRKETEKRQEERARLRERRRQAFIEDFG
jgi:hypothetical protein